MESGEVRNRGDLDLAGRAARGDLAAWHDFVTRYSGLIRAIVRRCHPGRPEDDQLSVYVEVLEYMYSTGLGRYDGRAALSTWVMTVTRSRALDALRRDAGRRRPPTWLEEFPPLDRRIYQLCFIDLQAAPAVLARLRREGHPLTAEALDEAIRRLESRMDRPLRRKLAYDLEARSVGAISGRLLETLDHLRLEQEAAAEADRPDHVLFQKRMRQLVEEIGECVRKLDETERRVIELRYFEDMSAPSIARRLELAGPRRVHVLIDRALARIRRTLGHRLRPPIHTDRNGSAREIVRRT